VRSARAGHSTDTRIHATEVPSSSESAATNTRSGPRRTRIAPLTTPASIQGPINQEAQGNRDFRSIHDPARGVGLDPSPEAMPAPGEVELGASAWASVLRRTRVVDATAVPV
jgi:hypothetical protein